MTIEYEYVSLDDVAEMTHELGERIRKSGFKPDCLLGVSRGGLPIVRFFSDFFGIKDVYTIKVEYYTDVDKRSKEPMIIQDIDDKLIKDKNILLIDDISDTGDSLLLTIDHVRKKGIKDLRTATLHYKPRSKCVPDFYHEEIDKWVIYPWEKKETIESIMSRDMSSEEKFEELRRTGIPAEWIKRYVDDFAE